MSHYQVRFNANIILILAGFRAGSHKSGCIATIVQVSQNLDRFLFFNRIYDINKGVFYHVTDIQSLLAE